MTRLYIIAAVIMLMAFAVGGCEDKNPAMEYTKGVTGAYKKAGTTARGANLDTANRASESFMAANGRYPADLAEITSFSNIELSADEYAYDPSNGRVSLK